MNIAILGAGTWGIALAKLLCENGNEVTVWSALKQEIEDLRLSGRHRNLPGIEIPSRIEYTEDIKDAITGKEAVLFSVASAYTRQVAKLAAPFINEKQIIIDVAKGIEPVTLYTMTEVIRDEFSKHIKGNIPKLVALSGPTHAEEVAANIPTSIVSACEDEECAKLAAGLFANSCMRVYTNIDVKGVELCGALKNIVALAAGMIRGMGYGDNTNAMLITRGIAEMTRMGISLGCKRRTFMGLAGIGDLIVTCTSRHSRNNKCGEYIGMGMTYDEASKKVGMVVEGYYALEAAVEMCEKYNVDMPIVAAVNDVVKGGKDPAVAMKELMNRAIRSELES